MVAVLDFCCNALGYTPERASENARERSEDQERPSKLSAMTGNPLFIFSRSWWKQRDLRNWENCFRIGEQPSSHYQSQAALSERLLSGVVALGSARTSICIPQAQ
jgi:hypothetical protein